MLWSAGIREPVRGGVEAGLRLGVGKAEEDDFYTAAENIVRKRLEVEVQAEEDEERMRRREVGPRHSLLLETVSAESRIAAVNQQAGSPCAAAFVATCGACPK